MWLVIAERSTSGVHWQLNTVGRKQKASLNEIVTKTTETQKSGSERGGEGEGRFFFFSFLFNGKKLKGERGKK